MTDIDEGAGSDPPAAAPTADDDGAAGWFVGQSDDIDADAAAERIQTGSVAAPRDWPSIAVDAGVVDSRATYYDRLHAAATAATQAAVRERERADDQQLVHAVRAMDDCEQLANELAERVAAWAGSRFPSSSPGIAGARALVDEAPIGEASTGEAQTDEAQTDELDRRVVSLATRVSALADERDALETTIEQTAPAVAPNLAAMAGATLAARLIALAGGLASLAKKPAGTVQVLGAEDALFAHLAGRAPSPKHGVIYTHEFVRGTRPDDRGSAARALAGKLALAARVDHYAGTYRESLHDDLRERMATIRARADEDGSDPGDADGAGDPEDADGAETEGVTGDE